MARGISNQQRLGKLADILCGKRRMLIVIQDFPDPDAIAAAVALREIVRRLSRVECSVAHGGIVGRAENRATVRYLGINLRLLQKIDTARFDLIALVDTQPGAGNNSLPPGTLPDIVIDHHPVRRFTRRVPYTDIRSRYGATSTILYEYLQEAGIVPDAPLATALFYGIWSDTQDLGRNCGQADIDSFIRLHAMANKRMLREIRYGRLPRLYFQMLDDALRNARLYGSAIVTGLGPIDNPDMIGEVADLLLRNRESRWALCYGFYSHRALFSVRTCDIACDAGKVAYRIAARKGSGGGHAGSAGGQLPIENDSAAARRRIEAMIVRRFLALTHQSEARGSRLVTFAD